MNTVKYFLSIVVIFLFVSSISCRRNSDEQIVASPYVSRFEIMQDGFTQKAVFRFHYDNSNRVTKFTGYIYNAGSIDVLATDTIFVMEFLYNSSEQLPERVIQRTTWPSTVTTRTHTLFYNQNKKLIKDSVVNMPASNNNPTRVINYRYNGNATIAETYFPGNTLPEKDSFVIVNNNIVLVERKFIVGLNQRIEYDFENSLNPLNRTNIAPIFFTLTQDRSPDNHFFSVWTLCSKNNISAIRYFNNGLSGNFYSLDYEKDINGLTRKRYWHLTQNSIIIDTIYYHY